VVRMEDEGNAAGQGGLGLGKKKWSMEWPSFSSL